MQRRAAAARSRSSSCRIGSRSRAGRALSTKSLVEPSRARGTMYHLGTSPATTVAVSSWDSPRAAKRPASASLMRASRSLLRRSRPLVARSRSIDCTSRESRRHHSSVSIRRRSRAHLRDRESRPVAARSQPLCGSWGVSRSIESSLDRAPRQVQVRARAPAGGSICSSSAPACRPASAPCCPRTQTANGRRGMVPRSTW